MKTHTDIVNFMKKKLLFKYLYYLNILLPSRNMCVYFTFIKFLSIKVYVIMSLKLYIFSWHCMHIFIKIR